MATTKTPRYELPEERPASFDEAGHRIALNPADVAGHFRKYRDWLYVLLIVIFLALPWTKFAGHQTVLIDLPQRRFAFFGITFWAHDVPLLFFVLGILTVGMAFLTATLGRVWCGWGCPQTVFIDRVYRRIERWIEGNHIERIRLGQAPMSWHKFRKKALKWFLFWFVSTNIAHSFTAYFIGAESLLKMSFGSPLEHWTAFVFVTSLTAIVLFDFGWFREQFCMIMCPYGRFQSVLMDQNSLAIMYDEKRGEPRKGTEPSGKEHGDCVSCYRCVSVCPTGIDIRRGVQMECVACTACIDACDEIMDKTQQPKGLIRYSSEAAMSGGKAKQVRPLTIAYAAVLLVLVVGFTVSVAQRDVLDVRFIRAIDTPYTKSTLPDGSEQIINHYRVHVKNQSFDVQDIALKMDGDVERAIEMVAPTYPLTLEGGKLEMTHVFFKFPIALTRRTGQYKLPLQIVATSQRGEVVFEETISLVGPFGGDDRGSP
jgi:cytochrome c oxidase accessory protein FixG